MVFPLDSMRINIFKRIQRELFWLKKGKNPGKKIKSKTFIYGEEKLFIAFLSFTETHFMSCPAEFYLDLMQ